MNEWIQYKLPNCMYCILFIIITLRYTVISIHSFIHLFCKKAVDRTQLYNKTRELIKIQQFIFSYKFTQFFIYIIQLLFR